MYEPNKTVHIEKAVIDKMARSIRAVVELHQPEKGHCKICATQSDLAKRRSYPCATILAIWGDVDV